ncbi:MAG: pyridoxamine 5'-phosphate oxidase [Chitinophagaceae bacterium]
MKIADIRKDYIMQALSEADTAEHPIDQFTRWWNEAVDSNILEPNAMTLSTATTTGLPAARIVLLKGYDVNGFVFFTNYLSQKGQNLAQNPQAALTFFWKELERQVIIQGTVEKIPEAESEAYFLSRPLGSRIGAWSSPQSSVIAGREILEENVQKYTQAFGENVPRPPHWGGYLVKPTSIEFWQGRASRLHDRIRYQLMNINNWKKERLAP